MSSPGDSTPPERATSVPANPSRRSFTLPARVASRPRPAPASATAPSADGIETLFVCNSTRIVSFTAPSHARRPSPSRRPRANSNDDTSEPIPWRSATERTLAAGVLRIYRVTSSNVSFLNSGDLLHTIFPRSQCWCVDGESIFVLRIRQDSYYRIELPQESAEDTEKVEQFRDVLRQVLHYERTRSPFAQSSETQVELPERPKTPPRRRYSNKPPEKAKKWLFDKKWKPDETSRPVTPAAEGSDVGAASSYDDDDRSSIAAKSDVSEAVTESPATNLEFTPPKLRQRTPSILERTKVFEGARSVTAPMFMAASRTSTADTKAANHPSRIEEGDKDVPKERKDSQDAQSIMSSTDSFYSLDTQPSPSPIFEDAVAELINPWAEIPAPQEPETRGRSTHRRQTSELTTRAPSEPADEGAPVTPTESSAIIHAHNLPLSSPPSTPPLMSDSDDDSVRPPSLDVPTPPPAIRMKRLTGASQKRAFSPMPRPQNLFRPRAQAPAKHFATALIRKTYELVLGPPAHLVQLMLRIAANISQGIFSFNTYRVPREDKLPCSWESSDEDEWRETDDFGIPLRRLDSESSVHRRRNYTADVD